MCCLVQKLIEANGVAGLQARQPSPHFQRLKDFAEDFVFDGSAGEDDGADFARLNYVGSKEPGDLSHVTTALGFVDHFLSCNDMNVSPGTALKNTVD